MRLLMLCVIGTMLIVSSTAKADDEIPEVVVPKVVPDPDWMYDLILLPKGAPTVVNGERLQCYNFDEYSLLLNHGESYKECEQETDLKSKKIEQLNLIVDQLKIINQLQKQSIGDMKVEQTRLFDLWKDENKKRHLAENKPNLGSWLGWTAAGVATAVLAGFIIQDQLGD